MSEVKATTRYRPETRLVHSGALRSQFGETSEALFLTQGFIYDTAEQCEARFKGGAIGLQWALRMHGFAEKPLEENAEDASAYGDRAA